MAETGDITAAAYITGQGHYLANTTIFYTTPSLDYLRMVYQRSIQSVVTALGVRDEGIALTKAPEYVGARHYVKAEAYENAIQALRSDMTDAREYTDWLGFVHYHNLYTYYVVLMFGFCVAARAIQSPLIEPDDVDEWGLAHFADKDTSPPYHARLIWLPEWVSEPVEWGL